MKISAVASHIVTTLTLYFTSSHHAVRAMQNDIHGGVEMGVPNGGCDDGEMLIQKDFDVTDFLCNENEEEDTRVSIEHEACLPSKQVPSPLHKCMTERITYEDQPPRAGAHRPLWPVYGEYNYVPPQRWIHSLEHGAIVFLYHPCAPKEEVDLLRSLAFSCLTKFILTPYAKGLSRSVTHAFDAPEETPANGQYNYGLNSSAVPSGPVTNWVMCPLSV